MSYYYWVVSTEGYLCARIMVIGGEEIIIASLWR